MRLVFMYVLCLVILMLNMSSLSLIYSWQNEEIIPSDLLVLLCLDWNFFQCFFARINLNFPRFSSSMSFCLLYFEYFEWPNLRSHLLQASYFNVIKIILILFKSKSRFLFHFLSNVYFCWKFISWFVKRVVISIIIETRSEITSFFFFTP